MGRIWARALVIAICLCVMAAGVHAADDSDASDGDDSATAAASDNDSPAAVAAPAVAAAPSAAAPSGVPADLPVATGQGDITMNFQDVDLPVLAKFISEITGKNFILDESVRGKVSVISPTKVTPDQAYQIFQSVLQIKGFTTTQAGSVIKIIPSRDVRNSAQLTQSQVPAEVHGDQYVTRMVKLRNIDASSVMSVIQPMISHDGLVAAFPQDNTLIVTDDAYNVQRLLRIVGSLDVQGMRQNLVVIPLKVAYAADLAQQIEKIMGAREAITHPGMQFVRPGMGVVAPAAQGGAATFNVVPDERTNSLIVLASPLEMDEIKDLVQKLDIRSPNEMYRIHVYHLKYAPAGDMVQVLNGLLGGSGAPGVLSPTTGRNSLGRGSSLGLLNGSAFGMGSGGYSGGYGGGYGGGGGGFGSTSSFGGMGGGGVASSAGGLGSPTGMRRGDNNNAAGASASSNGKSPDFENPVTVTADPATNSLVVSAAPQDFETLKQVIDQLDVPRVQVFVQAIIVEVSADRTKDIGVNFQSSSLLASNMLGVGSLNFGQLQKSLANPLGLTGLGIGLASGSKCSIPGAIASAAASAVASAASTTTTTTVPCDVALMTALETDQHTNVLSAPTLLTADNEEASIVVGENVPFVGSSSANAGLPGQIFNSVDRQNVGITLDIVPQVSQGEYVKLDLYEEVSNVVNGTVNNPLGPTTTIRSASTTVLVQNNRTAVIGGLLSGQTEKDRQGIPFLSDIPVLGNLISDNARDSTKQNLLVFLTPHIIRSRLDLQALALDERQKFVRALGRPEVNNMPQGQFEQLYQPSFNQEVSPQSDIMQYQLPPPAGIAPLPGAAQPQGSPAPGSTQEIGPSSRRNALPYASPVASAPPVTSLAPPTDPAALPPVGSGVLGSPSSVAAAAAH
jgi:general secretion pathway protein D